MLGKELRDAREATGLTQEKLAFATNLDRTYISQLENDHKSPTVKTLFLICDALNISAADLIARVERTRRSGKRR